MKSLVPWFCLVAAGSQAVFAGDGLIEYRQGEYFAAGKNLYAISGQDKVADYYLGRMLLYGFGELKNNNAALNYFIQSASKGFLPAQKLLGSYYLLKTKEPEIALNWFKKAAEAGDVDAQMYCASAYLFGYGVKANEDKARKYYIDAAKNGNAIAQYTLAKQFIYTRNMGNKQLGLIWLTKAAEKNDPKAQLKLGMLYAKGKLVTKDMAKAQSLIQESANQNNRAAMIELGKMAQANGDLEKAKQWFTKASDLKSTLAQVALAELYLDPKSKFHDAQIGFNWMLKAAQSGSPSAQERLSELYKEGKVVKADTNLVAEWASQAEKSKEAEEHVAPAKKVALWLTNDKTDNLDASQYQLRGIYAAWHNPNALKENNYNQSPKIEAMTRKSLYQPQFTLTNPKDVAINDYFDILAPMLSGNESNDWSFKRYPINRQIQALLDSESFALRHPLELSVSEEMLPYPEPPQTEYRNFVDEQLAVLEKKLNYQNVLNQLYNHAILGESDAQFELGQLYQYGITVAQNFQQARVYFELAAAQMDVRAEYNLGILYLEGKIQPADYRKGIEWMTDAAFKGNPYAQYALANIYEKGFKDPLGEIVVQPDHQQALGMYYLASSNHFGEAEYRLADYLVKENNAALSVAARNNRTQLIKKLYQGAADNGVAEAVLPLAFYNAIDKRPAIQKQAFDVAKREAQGGNPEAALLLGILYERGIGTQINPVESLYWYQQASLNPVNSFILGTYYAEGKGVTQDLEKARTLLEQSADAGFSYANLNLAILKKEAAEPFLDDLEKANEKNNSKAGLLLADYYLQQASDPDNMKHARSIYQHFAEKGDKEAQLKLAFLYDRGLGGMADSNLAAKWYTASAEQGQAKAQYLLGQLYQSGRLGNEPDYAQAKKWYQAAKKSFLPAAVALGFLYDTVDDNYRAAIENYELAAQGNHVLGLYNAGLVYEDGKGQPIHAKKAESYYLKAAEQGFAPAMSQLAGLYFRGDLGQRDEQKALHWYKKAAALGDRDATYQLGLLSETGVATKLNLADALKFYQQSAALGNAKAKLAMARMYQYGLGVPADLQHAADLYKELADNNNAYAQYQLATIYLDGTLGQRMPEQGKQLLELASKNGNQQANRMLQWIDAKDEIHLSIIEPVILNHYPHLKGQPADMMYFDALSEWNRGDEAVSRRILERLKAEYPHYAPAQQVYKQIKGQA